MRAGGPIRAIAAAITAVHCGVALAAEAPTITVQPNAPGWITVNYYHSGSDGVTGYDIERQDPAVSIPSYSPTGQWTDTSLSPSTTYAYRACAFYSTGPVCSPWVQATTMPPPPPPTNMSPPNITDVSVTADSLTVSWGAIGKYSIILARLEDAFGNPDQRDLRSKANSSYTFRNLTPERQYRISLKGCSRTLLGSSCGPWSEAVSLKTAAIPPPPPGPMTVEVLKDSVMYRNPTISGLQGFTPYTHRLDYCLRWGEECGKPAAEAFCKLANGGAQPLVASYKVLWDIGATTLTIGTADRCEDTGCDSFRYIRCKAPDGIATTRPDTDSDLLVKDTGIANKPIDGTIVTAPPPPPAPPAQIKRNKNVGGGP